MTFLGSAFLALWNDVEAGVEAEYEHWHTTEHVPERVGIPGFLVGRRYQSDAPGQPRYFTLYDVEEATVFESTAYLDVIDQPTPWSAVMRPRLTNVVRVPCETVGASGEASTGSRAATDAGDKAIKCTRFSVAPGCTVRVDALLAECAALPGVRRVRLGAVRDSVPGPFRRWATSHGPSHLLLLNGDDEASLRACRDAICAAITLCGGLDRAVTFDSYTLAFQIEHAQVDESLRRTGYWGCT